LLSACTRTKNETVYISYTPLHAKMPGRTLPTLPTAQVASHNTKESCYVTVGTKVYDITPFLDDHPGGAELVLEYGGKDIKEIMEDEVSHTHSESAWEILDDHLIGFMATEDVMEGVKESNDPFSIVPMEPSKKGLQDLERLGRDGDVKARTQVEVGKTEAGEPIYANTGMSNEDDLSKETDVRADYKTHKFLDLERPLFMQVFNGGFSKDFYLQQVHRPRHYKGGDSAPLFGNFLEPLTKTPWYVVPTFWLPPVAYGTYLAATHFSNPLVTVAYWLLGLGIWTVVEYGLHRCLFHVDDYLPDNRFAITAHFLLHGIHHALLGSRHAFLEARPRRLLLQLVRGSGSLQWWHLWLHLLRLHALLLAPQEVSSKKEAQNSRSTFTNTFLPASQPTGANSRSTISNTTLPTTRTASA
jgi:4-hydroxysphinganine ceramide fatty acyl 2-hydroxylase